jgi:antirestriction protein ArdC
VEERVADVLGIRVFSAFLHIMNCCRLLEVLKGDNRAIFQAASLASKAADFVMGRRNAGGAAQAKG